MVETVFAWPGIGRVLVQAVQSADYPLAQGAFLLIAFVLVTMNTVADLFYAAARSEGFRRCPTLARPPVARRRLARRADAARVAGAATLPAREPFAVPVARSTR